METDARPPQKLSSTGNLATNWKRWRKEFNTYMIITKGYNKPQEEQVAWLENLIGPIGLKALEKITFNNHNDEMTISIVLEKLDQFFNPAKNEIEERYKFFSKTKKGNESIDTFIRDLTDLAKSCNFGEQMENLIRDAVILDIKDNNLRKLLFEEKMLTIEKLKVIYKTYEINSEKIKGVSKLLAKTTDETKTVIPNIRRPRSLSRRPLLSKNYPPKNFTKGCWKCGQVHPIKSCPAFKSICIYCDQINHFSNRCPIAKLDEIQITSKTEPSVNKTISKSTEDITEAEV